MARVAINTGASANDGTGDNLRSAGGILNSNFLELYTYLGAGSTTVLSAPIWSSTNVGINTLRNVGIGTTNPRFALEVGAVGASGTTLFVNGDVRVTGIVTIGPASITLNGITNIINVGTGITINGSTGIISATAIVLGGTTLTGAAVTFITAGSGISVDQGTGNVTITATGGGGSSQWVTTAAGIHTLSNVGIGTTNPTKPLTVSGDALINGLTVGLGSGAIISNTAIGLRALYSNVGGTNNTGIGCSALYSNIGGVTNTATGQESLYFSNSSGNTANGYRSLYSNSTGSENTAVGAMALFYNTTGINNSANGFSALYSNTSGNYNTATGKNALLFNTTGSQNTANGISALYSNTTANNNTATGFNALFYNTIGYQNTANGASALTYNVDGYQNTATGSQTLLSNTGGNYNTANGFKALYYNTNGYNNTGIGISAGREITTGSKNTLLGSYDGNQNGLDIRTSNNNVVLSDGDGNIRFYANSSGNVGLGTTNPTSKLHVLGDVNITGIITVTDSRLQSVSEKSTIVSGNTVSLVYNTGGGNVAICTNPTGAITLNVTGIPTDSSFDNRTINFTVVAIQTSTGYACTTINLNGVSRTTVNGFLKYPGGVVSVASTNSYDIFNFTGINTVGSGSTTENYQILGMVNGNFK